MAIANFIPEVWSAKLLVELERAHVYGAPGVVNRDYEGEISDFGDTVNITNLVDPTIGTYTAHNDIVIEPVSDEQQKLLINQSKYFAFEVDDLEKAQARGPVQDEQARRAAYLLRDVSDRYLGALMALAVPAANQIAERTLTDAEEAYDLLVDLGVRLDEADVPTEGRFVIVSPKFHGLIQKDKRWIGAGDATGAAVRANGVVGEAAGLSVRKSNNVPNGPGAGAGKQIIAGSPIATTFAEQISKTEGFRMEKRFADGVKGLHLYGSKVVRPKALAAADVIL